VGLVVELAGLREERILAVEVRLEQRVVPSAADGVRMGVSTRMKPLSSSQSRMAG
jgi:hypothetical protein